VQYPGITDLSFVNGVFASPNRNMVAVGNDWGTLDIFRFPNGEGAKSLQYRAHS